MEKKIQNRIFRAVFGLLMYIFGMGLAFYWYDWKLALIIFLVVGAVTYELRDFKERFEE